MELNQDTLHTLRHPIVRVWDIIGSDCMTAAGETDESITNEMAVEACLDANRLQQFGFKEEDRMVTKLILEHTYQDVVKFLCEHIKLA
jgi:hypothetical protein